MEQKKHTGGTGLYIIMVAVNVGLLILFAWQTWEFVDWLFPDDQILMKLLTLLCFDLMALLWACLDLFYHFAVRTARGLVRWAWAISFVLSLLASVFYLTIKSMFRFQLTLDQATVNIGYGVVIFAVVLQVIFVTFFLYLEWNARHPYQDDYMVEPRPQQRRVATPRVQPRTTVTQSRTRKPVAYSTANTAQLTAPARRVKQLPPAQSEPQVTEEEEPELEEELSEQEVETEELEELEPEESYEDEEEPEEEQRPPLLKRLWQAAKP